MPSVGCFFRDSDRCLGLRSRQILQRPFQHVRPQNGPTQGILAILCLYVEGEKFPITEIATFAGNIVRNDHSEITICVIFMCKINLTY